MFGQFAFNAQKEANKALKKIEEKTQLNNTKGYSSLLLESKFEKDMLFFSELGKKVLLTESDIDKKLGEGIDSKEPSTKLKKNDLMPTSKEGEKKSKEAPLEEAAGNPISTDNTNITDTSGKDLSIEEAEAETKYNDPEAQNNMNEGATQEINESKEIIGQNPMDTFYDKLAIFMESVQKLYEEADVEPKLLTPSLDDNKQNIFGNLNVKELTESQVYEIYGDHLESKMKVEISKPIFEGTFNDKYQNDIKLIMESMVQSGVQLNAEETEVIAKYAIFENTLATTFKEIVMPRDTQDKIELFESTRDSGYFELFEENVTTLRKDVNDSVLGLVQEVAPLMFADAIGVDANTIQKFSGASKIININNK